MKELKEGDIAPDFLAINQNGEKISFKDYKGKKVVLYFYPKDNTPGCTTEACNLRDNYQELQYAGYEIVGVSPDSVKSHKNFINKYELPFTLIADENKEIATSYGVFREKKLYGKTFMGIVRTTFLISEDGKIERIISKVKTKDHSSQILNKKE